MGRPFGALSRRAGFPGSVPVPAPGVAGSPLARGLPRALPWERAERTGEAPKGRSNPGLGRPFGASAGGMPSSRGDRGRIVRRGGGKPRRAQGWRAACPEARRAAPGQPRASPWEGTERNGEALKGRPFGADGRTERSVRGPAEVPGGPAGPPAPTELLHVYPLCSNQVPARISWKMVRSTSPSSTTV